MTPLRFLTAFISVSALGLSISSAEWTQWRGPDRAGRSAEKNLLKEWPADGPPLVWQCEGLGKGFSSISIAEGRIYTMGEKQGSQWLICLDAKNHTEIWATKVGDGGDSPNGTPTIDDGMVYAVDRHGNVLCAEIPTGKEIWRANFGKDFGGQMMSGWGYSESPLIDGKKVILTPGGKEALMVALDKKTGKVIWKTKSPDLGDKGQEGAGYTGAVISNGAGVKQYVNLLGRAVVGVSAETGELLWHYNKMINGTANIPTPLVSGDFVFASTGYGAGAALLKLKKSGSKGVEAEEVYFLESGTFQNHHGGMVMNGDVIYSGNGHNNGFPICLNWKTGKIVWGEERHSAGRESAAVLLVDGNLIYRYQNGVCALVEASTKGYKERGSFKEKVPGGPAWAHPVVDGGLLYLRQDDALMCYDLRAKK